MPRTTDTQSFAIMLITLEFAFLGAWSQFFLVVSLAVPLVDGLKLLSGVHLSPANNNFCNCDRAS
jgi:hypothetical protein